MGAVDRSGNRLVSMRFEGKEGRNFCQVRHDLRVATSPKVAIFVPTMTTTDIQPNCITLMRARGNKATAEL